MKIHDEIRVLREIRDFRGKLRITAGSIGKVIAIYPNDDDTYIVEFANRHREKFFSDEIGIWIELVVLKGN